MSTNAYWAKYKLLIAIIIHSITDYHKGDKDAINFIHTDRLDRFVEDTDLPHFLVDAVRDLTRSKAKTDRVARRFWKFRRCNPEQDDFDLKEE